MQESNQVQLREQRFMDTQGQFWFWDVTFTTSYGPYPDPTTASAQLKAYTDWLNTQAQVGAIVPEPTVSSDVEQAVAEYVRLRDQRDSLSAAQKGELAALDDVLAAGEAYLLGKLQEAGVDSFKVSAGTVFTQKQVRFSIPDKAAFCDWVRATGQVELLQMRVAQTNLEQYLETSPDLPPGINVSRERVVRVRRK